MSLAWIFPAGLLALSALLLPLLIHLTRRSEHRLTEFSALRWLRTLPRPRHRLRLHEWPLLLLRLLLLASLALLLAQPILVGYGKPLAHVLVAPGLDPAQLRADAGAHPSSARWLWLAEGFPPVDTPMPRQRQPGASLLRELDAVLPSAATLTVIVPQHWDGADAQRLQLSRQLHWQVVPGSSSIPAAPPPTLPRLQVYADSEQEPGLRYLRAVQLAWTGRDPDPVLAASSASTPTTGNVAVWLSSAALPASLQQWLQQGGQVVLDARTPLPARLSPQPLWRDADGRVLLEAAASGAGRVLRFNRVLVPAQMPQLLEAQFPEQLRSLLQAPAAPRYVEASQYAPEQLPQRWSQPVQALSPWLLLLIAGLFLLERIIATSPRRRGMT